MIAPPTSPDDRPTTGPRPGPPSPVGAAASGPGAWAHDAPAELQLRLRGVGARVPVPTEHAHPLRRGPAGARRPASSSTSRGSSSWPCSPPSPSCWSPNSSTRRIEAAIDLFTDRYDPRARVAKDVAAGAVLVAAVNALVVAYLVFDDHFAGLSKNLLSTRAALVRPPDPDRALAGGAPRHRAQGLSGGGRPFSGGMPSGHAAVAFAGWTAVTFLTADASVRAPGERGDVPDGGADGAEPGGVAASTPRGRWWWGRSWVSWWPPWSSSS